MAATAAQLVGIDLSALTIDELLAVADMPRTEALVFVATANEAYAARAAVATGELRASYRW